MKALLSVCPYAATRSQSRRAVFPWIWLLMALSVTANALAESPAQPATTVRRSLRVIPPFSPGGQPAIVPVSRGGQASTGVLAPPAHPQLQPPKGPPLPAGLLAWDAERKKNVVPLGTANTGFSFKVTNVATEVITITAVNTTCGCTTAKLPPVPWVLAPDSGGVIEVTMTLAGKRGVLIKNLTVETDHGHQFLEMRADIDETGTAGMSAADRTRNLQIATTDRQAVLKGECAACHATPAIGKMSGDLFQAACVICHEAEQRAASVPDLRNLGKPTDIHYWRTWISASAEGKLMPAFGLEHGGILTDEQIESLAKYLMATMSSAPIGKNGPAEIKR